MSSTNKGVCIDDVIVTTVFIVLGILFGGHVVFGITNILSIIRLFQNAGSYSFIQFVQILFGSYLGGMVFYGGMLGGIAGLYLICRFSQFGHADVMYDMYAVCIPLSDSYLNSSGETRSGASFSDYQRHR